MATTLPQAAEDWRTSPGISAVPPDAAPSSASAAAEDVRYVARQPILDARGAVHGYELLFRAGPAASFSGDGDSATRSVLDNTVVFGLERLTGGLPAFVNCTREAILDRLVLVLPAQHTVLELLETLEPTPELLAACHELKTRGFRIALDDFEWTPAWQPFLSIADYVKVDLSLTTAQQRVELLERLHQSPAQLVAERVETHADLEGAKSEGFTLFQGYHFCRPVLMENRAIPSNRMVHLELLHALQEQPLDTRHIGNLVKRDASLTYRLLRMVNSPLYATRKEITSIHGALVMIGDAMFHRVAMLAIASELRGNHPTELLRMAFLRGRFCELASALSRQDPTEQYLLGILSLLPAMLGVAMEKIAAALPLRSEVQRALLGQHNAERRILDWLENYELGNWMHCDQAAAAAGFGKMELRLPQIYAEAVEWTEAIMTVAD